MRSLLLLPLAWLSLECSAQLNGHYTVDPNASGSTNYISFNAAFNALESQGVSGHVTFFVAEGVYLEQLTIDTIPGTSDTSTVTFTADTNNTAPAIIRHASACDSNWVVRFSNTDWLTLDNLTIHNSSTAGYCNTVIEVRNGSEHLTLSHCEVKAQQLNLQASYLLYSNGDNAGMELTNNHFHGATYGLYLWSPVWLGSEGFTATGNLFENQNYNPVIIQRYQDVVFHNNEITSDSGLYFYTTAITMSQCRGAEITNNRVHSSTGSGYRYGLAVYNCENAFLERGLIANNCILTGVNANTSVQRGAIVMSGSDYFDVVHNTFNVRSNSSTSIALNLYNGALNRFHNNIVRMSAGRIADQYASPAAFGGNHNSFYTPDSVAFYYYTTGSIDFATWAATTGSDTNTLWHDPAFIDEVECTTCDTALDNAGTPTGVLEQDLNGYLRSSFTPDIGATEFITPDNFSLGTDPTQCSDSLQLEVAGAVVQWWINGTSTQDPQPWIYSNCEPLTHVVNVSAANAYCGAASDSMSITLVPHPGLNTRDHLCKNEQLVLSPCGNNSATYQWSTGHTTRFVTVNEPGIYHLTKTELGCTYADSTVITQSDSLELPGFAEHCLHDAPIVFDASLEHAISYQWSGGNTPTNATNDFDSTAIYSVQVLDSFGCLDSATINLTVLDTPDAVISVDQNNWLDYEYDAESSTQTSALTTYYWQFELDDVPFLSSLDKTVLMTFTDDIVGKEVKARLWVDNGCGTGYTEHTFEIPTGIEKTKSALLQVYPNPVSEGAQFSCPTCTEPYALTLTDAAGRVQRQVMVNTPSSYWLERGPLPAGVYFYEVHSGLQKMTSGKLVLVP